MSDKNDYRTRIEEIDKKIIKLFEEKMDLVIKIVNYKKANNLPIYNMDGEKEEKPSTFQKK
ncbi:chorismate mutase [Clostridium beijerinckii]|uniref:Chorismate mutase n=1 Tax=Clostridium beijerinckii TaxID=1520 RepID=A0AAE5HAT4_CLOBE|nr:chorismate mutase [Clostridium beijerinckii]ALB46485.1 hypothetical protein X276_15145 [Clostridium beijerinckii NRRL B-598]NSB17151.1 chorismate mutase [Clostridium beijerinckii]OOM33766.1 hypothetical protein CLOBE_05220 [Clostridium beijerinckii]